MADMNEMLFENTDFGKAALKIMGDVPENFRLYESEWVGRDRHGALTYNTMRVVGAEFRVAKRGVNKGKLSIKIPKTERIAYLKKEEIEGLSNG